MPHCIHIQSDQSHRMMHMMRWMSVAVGGLLMATALAVEDAKDHQGCECVDKNTSDNSGWSPFDVYLLSLHCIILGLLCTSWHKRRVVAEGSSCCEGQRTKTKTTTAQQCGKEKDKTHDQDR